MKICATYEVKIFIGGDLRAIEQACRRFCLIGLCVSVSPTNFIYTGAAESGAVIHLFNYARFPAEPEVWDKRAMELAKYLLSECCQRSCTVMTPTESHYLENEGLVVPK